MNRKHYDTAVDPGGTGAKTLYRVNGDKKTPIALYIANEKMIMLDITRIDISTLPDYLQDFIHECSD